MMILEFMGACIGAVVGVAALCIVLELSKKDDNDDDFWDGGLQ